LVYNSLYWRQCQFEAAREIRLYITTLGKELDKKVTMGQ